MLKREIPPNQRMTVVEKTTAFLTAVVGIFKPNPAPPNKIQKTLDESDAVLRQAEEVLRK